MKKLILGIVLSLIIILFFSINVQVEDKINEINNLISEWNPQAENSKLIAKTIYFESKIYDVNRRSILAIAIQESDFNKDAIGSSGEIGIMQIKPNTAKDMLEKDESLEIHKIKDNIILGIRYFKFCRYNLYKYADNNNELLLLTFAAYNQGLWGVKSKLEKGNSPINEYAEEAFKLREAILNGNLN
ncbi:MAG: lytic transglycosylase domain-containing protein [bacterium]